MLVSKVHKCKRNTYNFDDEYQNWYGYVGAHSTGDDGTGRVEQVIELDVQMGDAMMGWGEDSEVECVDLQPTLTKVQGDWETGECFILFGEGKVSLVGERLVADKKRGVRKVQDVSVFRWARSENVSVGSGAGKSDAKPMILLVFQW